MAKKEQDMVELGRKGGKTTLKRKGSKFFSKISKKRKNFKGGKPRSKKKKAK